MICGAVVLSNVVVCIADVLLVALSDVVVCGADVLL